MKKSINFRDDDDIFDSTDDEKVTSMVIDPKMKWMKKYQNFKDGLLSKKIIKNGKSGIVKVRMGNRFVVKYCDGKSADLSFEEICADLIMDADENESSSVDDEEFSDDQRTKKSPQTSDQSGKRRQLTLHEYSSDESSAVKEWGMEMRSLSGPIQTTDLEYSDTEDATSSPESSWRKDFHQFSQQKNRQTSDSLTSEELTLASPCSNGVKTSPCFSPEHVKDEPQEILSLDNARMLCPLKEIGSAGPLDPKELKDGLPVWAVNINCKKNEEYWPARVCDPNGKYVQEEIPPVSAERFKKMLKQSDKDKHQLVYIHQYLTNEYTCVPKKKIRPFDDPGMLHSLQHPNPKKRLKINYSVYFFCMTMGLDHRKYVGDYVPVKRSHKRKREDLPTEATTYKEAIKFNEGMANLLKIYNRKISYSKFWEILCLLKQLLQSAKILTCELDSDYLSIDNLVVMIKACGNLIHFVEGNLDDHQEVYSNICKMIGIKEGTQKLKDLEKEFQLAIKTTLLDSLYYTLIAMSDIKLTKRLPTETVKTKVCLLRHLALLVQRIGDWQAHHSKAANDGLKEIKGTKRQKLACRGDLSPSQGDLSKRRTSAFEIDVCICCGVGGAVHNICDACPGTYNKICIEKIRGWGLADSDCDKKNQLPNGLWYCPLCYHSFLLYRAVELNDFGKVIEMEQSLQGNFLWVNRMAPQSSSPLHIAAVQNNHLVLELLLQPLRKGLFEGLEEENQSLHGTDLNSNKLPIQCLPEDAFGLTPFQVAKEGSCMEAMLALSSCYKDLTKAMDVPDWRGVKNFKMYQRGDSFWQEEGKRLLSSHWLPARERRAVKRGNGDETNGNEQLTESDGHETTMDSEEEDTVILWGEDITQGREMVKIPWVNEVDDETPGDFVYLTHSICMEGIGPKWDNSLRPQLSRCGPSCKSHVCNTSGTCHERRRRNMDRRNMLECNYRCPCSPGNNPNCFLNYRRHGRREVCNCGNRNAENGVNIELSLAMFKTKKKGWAVRTLKFIAKDTFICVYAGEVITPAQGAHRELIYQSEQKEECYMMTVGSKIRDSSAYMLDSTKFRNIGGFFNHTCSQPNLEWRRIFSNHDDTRLPTIAFYAACDIRAGEELVFTYDRHSRNKPHDCHCGHCGWAY